MNEDRAAIPHTTAVTTDARSNTLFDKVVTDYTMTAAQAMLTTVGSLSIAWVGLSRLIDVFTTDEDVLANPEHEEFLSFSAEMAPCLEFVKRLAERLEYINHRVMEACTHAPNQSGNVTFGPYISLNVQSVQTMSLIDAIEQVLMGPDDDQDDVTADTSKNLDTLAGLLRQRANSLND